MSETPNLGRGPHRPCSPDCTCGCHQEDSATYRPVVGHCPMGCGQTLGISVWPKSTDASMVTCFDPRCPDPRAVDKIMRDDQTEHVVTLSRSGFTIKHPLKERLGYGLEACALHGYLQQTRPREAEVPGRYRVEPALPSDLDPAGWRFTLLQPTEVAD